MIDDLASGRYRVHVNELQCIVCSTHAPVFAESEAAFGRRGRNFFAKRSLLPLSDDGARVKQILAMVRFRFAAGRQIKTVLDGAAATTPAAY